MVSLQDILLPIPQYKERIETSDETILVNELLGELFICTDSRYEVLFTYNKVDNTFTLEAKTDGF